jgi:hypothetical protein
VHQGDHTKKAVLDTPEYVADKIRREPPPNLTTGRGANDVPTVGERAYQDQVAKYTNCTKTGCSLAHIRRYKHIVHLDPSRPGISISKARHRSMIKEEDKQCHHNECDGRKINIIHPLSQEHGKETSSPVKQKPEGKDHLSRTETNQNASPSTR